MLKESVYLAFLFVSIAYAIDLLYSEERSIENQPPDPPPPPAYIPMSTLIVWLHYGCPVT